MKMKIFSILITGLMVIAAITGSNLFLGPAAAKTGTYVGDQAADFKLTGVDGKQYQLSDVVKKHQVTVVNFWATWCPPCRAEIPDFVRFLQQHAKKKVVILAVNLQESPDKVRDFAKGAGMKFPVLTDTSGKVGNTYSIYAIPTTFFIDGAGTIRQVIEGSTNYNRLLAEVKALLKEK
jgi:cytochrome c biogenesis protein CcmG/thiol:disulfide interchange protein DsbE